MNYTEALAYLDSFINLERSGLNRAAREAITLDSVRELAGKLGNPEEKFPSIHVAGTKGKGSTCAFAAAMLREAGLKTALYVSPHLQDIRERITVNGVRIPETDFARILTVAQPVLEQMRRKPEGERKPTYFEVLTHIAFTWFAEQSVDIAVIEVGLGGRLDATNIVEPVACGITNISFDHMAVLGETLELIAKEKAGILKPGVPAVIAPQRPEAAQAIDQAAAAVRAPCLWLMPGEKFAFQAPVEPFLRAQVELADGGIAHARLGLRGLHQFLNWMVAVRLAELAHLYVRGKPIAKSAVEAGSANVVWPGRLEELPQQDGVRLILDGAHNDHSLEVVLNAIFTHEGASKPLIVVFGCAKDKDCVGMLRVLNASSADAIVFTHSGNARSKEPGELAAAWNEATHRECHTAETAQAALQLARTLAAPKGLVLVTGSLYLVGAVKDLFDK